MLLQMFYYSSKLINIEYLIVIFKYNIGDLPHIINVEIIEEENKIEIE